MNRLFAERAGLSRSRMPPPPLSVPSEYVPGPKQIADALFGQTMTKGEALEKPSPEAVRQLQLAPFKEAGRGFIEGMAEFDPSDLVNPMAAAPAKGAAKATKSLGKTLMEQFYDQLRPVKGFSEDAYKAARLHAGTPAKAMQDIERVGEAVKPLKPKGISEEIKQLAGYDLEAKAAEYIKLDRMEEVAGLTKADPAKLAEIQAKRAEVEKVLKPDELARVKETQKNVTEVNNAMLKEARDAGLISDQNYQTATRRGLKYAPLAKAMEAAEEVGPSNFRKAQSYSVNTDFFQKLQGLSGAEDIADPIQSTVDRIVGMRNQIEKNKVLRTITNLPSQDPSFVGQVVPIKTVETMRKRMELAGRISKHEDVIGQLTEGLRLKGRVSSGLVKRMEDAQAQLASLSREVSEAVLVDWKGQSIVGDARQDLKSLAQKIQTRRKKQIALAEKLVKTGKGSEALYLDITKLGNEIAAFKRELAQVQNGKLPEGFKEISVFREGLKETWAIPADVHEALQGLNAKQADLVTRIASRSAAALRAGATTLNLGFVAPNTVRDYYSVSLNSPVGFNPVDWLKGFASAVKKDDTFKDFIKAGGGFSSFSELGKSAPTAKELTDGKLLSAARTITSPSRLMELISAPAQYTELAPRLGAFQRARKMGLSDADAAFIGRDSTVDFNKAGASGKLINQWVPFLNARVQGTANMLRSFRDRPARSMAVAGGLVAMPTINTYIWNKTRFPEVWDDIATYEKDNNFILIMGDEKDERGNYTNVYKIPKGDVGKTLGNPIEAFMEHLWGRDQKGFTDVAMEVGSDMLPVNVYRDGKLDPSLMASSALPPTVKVMVETGLKKNLFTGRDIVPMSMQKRSPEEQFYHDTPEWAVEVGDWLGMSPLVVMNALGTQFGGLGRQVADPSRAGESIARRFVGAHGGQLDREWIERIGEMEQGYYDERGRIQRSMQGSVATRDRNEIRERFKQQMADAPTGALKEYVDSTFRNEMERTQLSSLEWTLKNGGRPSEVVAAAAKAYIASQTPERRKEVLARWKQLEIVPEDLLKTLEEK